MPDTPMTHTTDNVTEVPVTKTERKIMKECIKMYVKYDWRLQDQLKNMYYIICGKVIDELCTRVKCISGFSAAADKFEDIGLLKLIQKDMFNVQSQQYFPAAVHMIKMGFY